jgi:hypothetical protein
MFFDTKLPDHKSSKLSDLDWMILSGLEGILEVS